MNIPNLKIACVGEAMIELALNDRADQAAIGFAGDTLNTAIYLRRNISAHHDVAFVTVLGQDDFSGRMFEFIQAEGVSTSRILRHPSHIPGLYAITTDDTGERSFVYWRENSAARQLFRQDGQIGFSVLEGFDVVYLSAITLAILPENVREALFDWLETFRAQGGRFAFDSNYRPRLWAGPQDARRAVERAWRLCDIGLPSVDDEMELFADASTQAAIDRLKSYAIPAGAIKCGASGPVPISGETDPDLVFPPAERVVDTTAAGDSFVGGFLASYLTGGDQVAAMRAGHDCAAKVIAHRGAIIPRDA